MTHPDENPIESLPTAVLDGDVGPLPDAYAESENALITALLADLDNYEVSWGKRSRMGYSQAIKAVAPILDRVGIDSLEGLRDLEALVDLRKVVTRADAEGKLGAPATSERYLTDFAKRCVVLGLSEPDSARLVGLFKQARKDSGRPIVKAPPITVEMLASMLEVMDAWADAPAIPAAGCPDGVLIIDGDVVTCSARGWRLTPRRRDRILAFIAMQVCGAMRSGDTLDLRRGDIRGRRIQARKHKGRINPTMFSFELFEPFAGFVDPLIERFADAPDEKRLFDSNVTKGVRALLLAAGWPTHYNRVGLHNVRKTAMQANYEAGVPASEASPMLGNTGSVAETIYADNSKAERESVARANWAAYCEDNLEETPDWDYDDTHPPVPWELLSAGHPWTLHSNPWEGERPLDDPQGEAIPIGEGQGAPFNGLWRFRQIIIEMPWGEHRDDVAYESNQGDLVVRHYPVDGKPAVECGGRLIPPSRTVWLLKGGLAKAAPAFWARAELEDGGPAWIRTSIKCSWLPIEVIISRYAALVESALDEGRTDEARRLLMLLKSLGGIVE